jgi:hypothetical protein
MDFLVVESSQTILLQHLMKNYSKEIRPWNNNGATEVELDVAIIKLILVVLTFFKCFRAYTKVRLL